MLIQLQDIECANNRTISEQSNCYQCLPIYQSTVESKQSQDRSKCSNKLSNWNQLKPIRKASEIKTEHPQQFNMIQPTSISNARITVPSQFNKQPRNCATKVAIEVSCSQCPNNSQQITPSYAIIKAGNWITVDSQKWLTHLKFQKLSKGAKWGNTYTMMTARAVCDELAVDGTK